MKKEYVVPFMCMEEYCLTTPIAGSCSSKTHASDAEKQVISRVHCVVYPTGEVKNCSDGAHTWTVDPALTIFSDGPENTKGCTTDVSSQAEYVALLETTFNQAVAGGSTVSGGVVGNEYFAFKGSSAQHTASFVNADYSNYFKS